MKNRPVLSAFTYLMMFGALGVGIWALIVYVILPGIDTYHLEKLTRKMEKEGVDEAKVPTNDLVLPGPIAEEMIKYGPKSVPYFLLLMEHIEMRVRAKAWDALVKVTKNQELYFDPGMSPDQAKADIDRIREWWVREQAKPKKE